MEINTPFRKAYESEADRYALLAQQELLTHAMPPCLITFDELLRHLLKQWHRAL
jgi:hypothetical protein